MAAKKKAVVKSAAKAVKAPAVNADKPFTKSETYAYLGLYWTWGGHEDAAARPVAWSRTSAAPAL